jgi:hypothetical protein
MPIYINNVIHEYFVNLNQTYDTPLEQITLFFEVSVCWYD